MLDPKSNYHRYRIFYSKTSAARFIGHLDLQSFFNKAFKRANLPVAYSQGFNPHQLLSIAMPLSMGMMGHNEIVEIYLTKQVNVSEMIDSLNKQMPEGMSILDVKEVPNIGKSAAGLVHGAKYRICFLEEDAQKIEEGAKKVIDTADFLDKVIDLKFDGSRVDAKLCAGSAKNLKPQVLAQYLIEKLGLISTTLDVRYERTEILI
ncbi:MAG: TIGR03936 family radical SAM-associated protein [Defluviitaleaceae bacterium]|nr:TIGR03936 family radical SAM-associated protein [Defluviitaleaceae bacterium]